MALLTPLELVGITQLASAPEVSYLYQQAALFHQHNGRIEEIIALQSSLLLPTFVNYLATNKLFENGRL